jgi:hypothetical protein
MSQNEKSNSTEDDQKTSTKFKLDKLWTDLQNKLPAIEFDEVGVSLHTSVIHPIIHFAATKKIPYKIGLKLTLNTFIFRPTTMKRHQTMWIT